MKRIGKIITAVGIGIMFFGGMCDADGIYYYYLIAVIALGALVSLAGLAIMSVELRRAERQQREEQMARMILAKNWAQMEVEDFLSESKVM